MWPAPVTSTSVAVGSSSAIRWVCAIGVIWSSVPPMTVVGDVVQRVERLGLVEGAEAGEELCDHVERGMPTASCR